jgi:hypothetical protein
VLRSAIRQAIRWQLVLNDPTQGVQLPRQQCTRTAAGGRASQLVKGNRKFIKSLADNFRSNEWQYYVVTVQPGFKCASILSSGKIQGLVSSAYEWITNAGATFVIWGS